MVLLADLYCVVKDLLDLYVRSKILLVKVVSRLQDTVDPQSSNLDGFRDGAHSLVEILHAVIDLVLLTYLQALFDGEVRIFLEGVDQVVRFVLRHQLNKSED